MSADLLTAIVLALVAFLGWIVQGQTEYAFGSALVILLAYGLPAYMRKDTDRAASSTERWVIIGIGVICIAAALYRAFV